MLAPIFQFSFYPQYGKLIVIIKRSNIMTEITIDYLKEVLSYDANTGLFTWIKRSSRPDLIGKIAGSRHSSGYSSIAIYNKKRLAHRLAWFYMTNEWPINHIDHIDGNRLNNAFTNLRDVTRSENLHNVFKAKKNNKAAILGVSAHQGKWRMQIMVNGVTTRISGFDTPEEAHQAYLGAKRKYHAGCTI
jgi:hypothetical protein